MSDKTTLLRVFNKHFFEFLEDIASIVTDNSEIMNAVSSCNMLKRVNPTAIIKAWYTHVYCKYKNVIEDGNISFFFEKDYSSDLESVNNANEIMNIIDKIREPIKNMSKGNQSHTIKYIQNLSKISQLYSEQ
jgi:hypothetical protein